MNRSTRLLIRDTVDFLEPSAQQRRGSNSVAGVWAGVWAGAGRWAGIACVLLAITSGCASGGYQFGHRNITGYAQASPIVRQHDSGRVYAENSFSENGVDWSPHRLDSASPDYLISADSTGGNPISVGGDHPRLDKIERFIQKPIRWFRKRAGDDVSPAASELGLQQSVALSQQYLTDNGLDDVYIDVRRYEPREQWQRLRENQRIAPFWKYTFGSMAWLRYSLIPHRVIHSDRYDPFTNTLNLNSEQATAAYYETAAAKVFRSKRYMGTYAALQRLPLVPIEHSVRVGNEALGYARATGNLQLEQETYPRAYADVGATTAGEALSLASTFNAMPWYVFPIGSIAGRASGSAAGEWMANRQTQN